LLSFMGVEASAQQPASPSSSSSSQSSSPSQSPATPAPADASSHPNESKFFIHLAEDQKDIWTSPFHLQPADAKWLVPSAGITAGLFVTDSDSAWAMHWNNLHRWNVASNAGLAAEGGVTGAAYLWGRMVHNERARDRTA
jgi:hypothetical protein